MASVRLPRLLSETVGASSTYEVTGATVGEAFEDLFAAVPGLRNHILDESGSIRPHVSVFVDGDQAELITGLREHSELRVLHAVSGG